MQWDRECCSIHCPSDARHNAGGARRLHGTRWVHGMDLLGAAGELGMCGSKEELCLQLLIGVHVYVCVCVHHCLLFHRTAAQKDSCIDGFELCTKTKVNKCIYTSSDLNYSVKI